MISSLKIELSTFHEELEKLYRNLAELYSFPYWRFAYNQYQSRGRGLVLLDFRKSGIVSGKSRTLYVRYVTPEDPAFEAFGIMPAQRVRTYDPADEVVYLIHGAYDRTFVGTVNKYNGTEHDLGPHEREEWSHPSPGRDTYAPLFNLRDEENEIQGWLYGHTFDPDQPPEGKATVLAIKATVRLLAMCMP